MILPLPGSRYAYALETKKSGAKNNNAANGRNDMPNFLIPLTFLGFTIIKLISSMNKLIIPIWNY